MLKTVSENKQCSFSIALASNYIPCEILPRFHWTENEICSKMAKENEALALGAGLHIVKQLEDLDRMITFPFLPFHNHIGSFYEEANLTKGSKGN